jgi:hypothetical protein
MPPLEGEDEGYIDGDGDEESDDGEASLHEGAAG